MKKREIPYYKRNAVIMRCVVFGLQTTVLLFQARSVVFSHSVQPCDCQPTPERLS
jgi:hypothetical protein